MINRSTISREKKKLIRYIDYNINEIEIKDRIAILNMLCSSGTPIEDMYEEGTGIRISYINIANHQLEKMKEQIIEGKKKTHLILSDD